MVGGVLVACLSNEAHCLCYSDLLLVGSHYRCPTRRPKICSFRPCCYLLASLENVRNLHAASYSDGRPHTLAPCSDPHRKDPHVRQRHGLPLRNHKLCTYCANPVAAAQRAAFRSTDDCCKFHWFCQPCQFWQKLF